MSDSPVTPPTPTPADGETSGEHPRGTLAVVLIYGALFILGWLGLYVFAFLSRGAPRP